MIKNINSHTFTLIYVFLNCFYDCPTISLKNKSIEYFNISWDISSLQTIEKKRDFEYQKNILIYENIELKESEYLNLTIPHEMISDSVISIYIESLKNEGRRMKNEE